MFVTGALDLPIMGSYILCYRSEERMIRFGSRRSIADKTATYRRMILSRQSRAVATLVALFSLLFMQLAVAAYACPNLLAGNGGAVTSMSAPDMEDMPACGDAIDMEQPGLCQAHAQVGNQSLDKPTVSPVQPFIPVALAQEILFVDAGYVPLAALAQPSSLTRITSPTAVILHCCFRI